MVKIGEGEAATNGASWGDYSGSMIDGDNPWIIFHSKRDNVKGKAESVI